MEKTHLQSNLSFRLMALEYRWRDRRQPPFEILQDIGVKPGMAVLDFGCGPGSFSLAAAKLVGSAGQVYAVDIHPLAIRYARRAALREKIADIRLILGNDIPGVSEATIDVVLLFNVLHHISDPGPVLARF
jgi:ubiquinone/menaquinone biosynthesis C-methylase UbiE